MSVPVFLLGCLGGGIGACLRYLGDGLVMRRATPGFPSGIFLVNTLGSFLLGLLVGSFEAGLVDGTWLFVLGGGVLGGFTTFSTAMVDTVRLMHQEAWGRAAANAVGMLVVGVVLALLGLTLGRGL